MSMCRRCDIFKAKDNQWYVVLGDFEHAEDLQDCTAYGPFPDEDSAYQEVRDYHSNPGSVNIITEGDCAVPAPDWVKCELPTKERRARIRYRW